MEETKENGGRKQTKKDRQKESDRRKALTSHSLDSPVIYYNSLRAAH